MGGALLPLVSSRCPQSSLPQEPGGPAVLWTGAYPLCARRPAERGPSPGCELDGDADGMVQGGEGGSGMAPCSKGKVRHTAPPSLS